MKNKKNLRITSVPRCLSPGAAYHPLYYAKKFNDKVIPIPGISDNITHYKLSYSERFLKKMPLKFIRFFFMIELFILALFEKKGVRSIFVHSFWYAIPFMLFAHKPTLIIHGSDFKYLFGIVGKIVNKYCNVFIVGKKEIAEQLKIASIPNIFRSPSYVINNKKIIKDIDFIFILRNAPVKNPKFPKHLFNALDDTDNVKIAVIGIEGESEEKGECMLTYLGIKNAEEVDKLLSRSKVFVLPSLHEGVPKALFEAMFNDCSIIVNTGIETPKDVTNAVTHITCNQEVNKKDFINMLKLYSENNNNRNQALNYLKSSEKQLDNIYNI